MAGLLLCGNDFGNGDENLDGQETDAVLVILDEVLEQGYHFLDDNRGRHLLDKLGEICGSLAADHGGFIVDEKAKLLAQLLLDRRRSLLVGGREKTTARDLGCEPVGFREAEGEGDEVFFDLFGRELLADLVEGFDGLIDGKG